jgi:hypothetical protein
MRRLALALLIACTPSPAQPPLPTATPTPATNSTATSIASATPADPNLRLPGACVDPEAYLRRHYKDRFGVVGEIAVDIDGDGYPDRILAGSAVDITQDYFVFVIRGSCGHFVGLLQTEAGGLQPTSNRTNGLFDLEGTRVCRRSCCPTSSRFTFKFDGTAYKLAETKPITRNCSGP